MGPVVAYSAPHHEPRVEGILEEATHHADPQFLAGSADQSLGVGVLDDFCETAPIVQEVFSGFILGFCGAVACMRAEQ